MVVSPEIVNWNIADNAKGVNSSNQTRITLPRKRCKVFEVNICSLCRFTKHRLSPYSSGTCDEIKGVLQSSALLATLLGAAPYKDERNGREKQGRPSCQDSVDQGAEKKIRRVCSDSRSIRFHAKARNVVLLEVSIVIAEWVVDDGNVIRSLRRRRC